MKLQTAKGVKDIIPEKKIIKDEIISKIKKIFENYGFLPLETPILERYETLSAKYAGGSEILKETFTLKDQGNRKLGLRFDLTVPLARFVGMNPNLKMPFKKYEIGRVFRDGPIKLGRVREFWQCDADIIGSKSMLADAEILSLAQDVFKELNLNVIIKINNRKLLNGILESVNIKNKEDAITPIDKLAKIGFNGVKKELEGKKFTEKQINSIFKILKEKNLSKFKINNTEGLDGLKELKELFNYLKILNVKFEFDPSLARGLSYYTGTVFEIFLKKGIITSSLAAGGRWDKMIGNFTGKEYPAVGIAFGLEPITELITEVKKTITKVYVIPIDTLKESLKFVKELRNNNINSDTDLVGKGVTKNLDYADKYNIPFVIFIGKEELKKKKFKLRDMVSGKEKLLTKKEIIKRLSMK